MESFCLSVGWGLISVMYIYHYDTEVRCTGLGIGMSVYYIVGIITYGINRIYEGIYNKEQDWMYRLFLGFIELLLGCLLRIRLESSKSLNDQSSFLTIK